MKDDKIRKSYSNLAEATVKSATEDYNDLCEKGVTHAALNTIPFFLSEYFDDLATLAGIDKVKLQKFIDQQIIHDTPRAEILNWIFDRKHFDGNNSRIMFTSPEQLNKVVGILEDKREDATHDWIIGVNDTLDYIFSIAFENKFCICNWILTEVNSGKVTRCAHMKEVAKRVFDVKKCSDEFEEQIIDAYRSGKILKRKGSTNQYRITKKYSFSEPVKAEAVQAGDEDELYPKDNDDED